MKTNGTPRRRGKNVPMVAVSKSTPIYKAVLAAGGMERVGIVLGISRMGVWKWISERRINKTEHAVALAKLAGVDVAPFCPLSAEVETRIAYARQVTGAKERRTA